MPSVPLQGRAPELRSGGSVYAQVVFTGSPPVDGCASSGGNQALVSVMSLFLGKQCSLQMKEQFPLRQHRQAPRDSSAALVSTARIMLLAKNAKGEEKWTKMWTQDPGNYLETRVLGNGHLDTLASFVSSKR